MNTLNTCLALSVGVHTLLLGWVRMQGPLPEQRRNVSEISFVPATVMEPVPQWLIKSMEKPAVIPPYIKEEHKEAAQHHSELEKPPLKTSESEEVFQSGKDTEKNAESKQLKKELVSISKEKIDEIKKTPAYMQYYDFIHNKIKKTVTERFAYSDEGEVLVVFVLSRNGTVASVEVDQSLSKAGENLKKDRVKQYSQIIAFSSVSSGIELSPNTF